MCYVYILFYTFLYFLRKSIAKSAFGASSDSANALNVSNILFSKSKKSIFLNLITYVFAIEALSAPKAQVALPLFLKKYYVFAILFPKKYYVFAILFPKKYLLTSIFHFWTNWICQCAQFMS